MIVKSTLNYKDQKDMHIINPYRFGKQKAGYFNGTSAYVSFGDIGDLGLSDGEIELDIKPHADWITSKALTGIIQKSRLAANDGRWGVYGGTTGSGSIEGILDASATNIVTAIYRTNLSDSAWRKLRCVWDRDGNMTLYIAGSSVGSSSISAASTENFNTTDYFFVGAYQNSGGQAPQANTYFKGYIANIKITVGGAMILNCPDPSTGVDISGNGNNGTVYNVTQVDY